MATKKAVGPDYTVGMRMLGEEFTKEGKTPWQSARIARRMAALGIDYMSISAGERVEDADPPPNFPPFAGTGYSGYRMSPRWWNRDGVQVYLAQGVREAIREEGYDVPVVCAGKSGCRTLRKKSSGREERILLAWRGRSSPIPTGP